MPASAEPSSPTIREAALGDADAVHGLAAQLADAIADRVPDKGAIRARLSELLEEPRARVLVAESGDGAVVGAVSLWIKPDLAHGDTVVEVPMLVVAEEARRGGVGRLLMQEVLKVSARENAALVELIATSDNEEARAFYRSLGFVETDHVALEFVGEMEDPPSPED